MISSKSKIHLIFLLLILFFITAHPLYSQLYRPLTPLNIIKTEYFDIIFPSESEASARLLAAFADQVYVEMSAILGISLPQRLPVTITPHTELFNGYYRILPLSHIVLYDTPMNIGWTTFHDNLRALFIHELAHAISLNTRNSFNTFLHKVFGNWASPALIYAPPFMVEGVTIAFESRESFGRANDPRIRQYLRQAIHEDRFLTPLQASSLYDIPLRESYYDYGGLFSHWLIENYGMEKYSELWQAIGGYAGFSFFVYRSGFYRMFFNVYGLDFINAWHAFRDSLALDNLENNANVIIPGRENFYTALSANNGNLYYLNLSENNISIYNIATRSTRRISVANSYDLDISSDASALLLSAYDFSGDRALAVVYEYNALNGRKTGRMLNGIYNARYFRDGVIGLASDLHNNMIIFEDFNGAREILLRGNRSLMFSSVQVLDSNRIIFIAAHEGVRELWLYDYHLNELYRIDFIDTDWHNAFVRDLSVTDGKIFFIHNGNDRMYKLAFLDLENREVIFSTRDFSGGIFHPVYSDDSLYYIGSFTGEDRILRFPEQLESLSGVKNEIILSRIFIEDYEIIENLFTGTTYTYNSLSYMNLLNFWLPLPLIRGFGGDLVQGAGVISLIADPAERNFVIIEAYGDFNYQMALINQFSWQSMYIGFPLTLSFSDRIIDGNSVYRSTTSNLLASYSWSRVPLSYNISFGAGFARNANEDSSQSAYHWKESESFFYGSASFGVSNSWFSLYIAGISHLNHFIPRVDAALDLDFKPRFPLNLSFFGAYDDSGMNLHSVSNTYSQTLIPSYALVEYRSPENLNLNWIGGAELGIEIFSWELQSAFSHFYFNRITGNLSLRNQIYDSLDHADAEGIPLENYRIIQSLMLRLGMEISVLPIVKVPLMAEPYVYGTWKFSNTITNAGSIFSLGLGLNITF